MYTTKVQRTYGSRSAKSRGTLVPPSSPPSALASSPPASPVPTRPLKRSFSEVSEENIPPIFSFKRTKTLPKASSSKLKQKPQAKEKTKSQKTLTQLHFNIDQTILRTCSLCDLSYTKGAPDDEALHRAHCLRVRQGMEWGREEEKDRVRGTNDIVTEVASDVKLNGKNKRGRIICVPADTGGKIGAKLSILFQTINLSLSAPDLPPSVLQSSKVYLFLTPHESQAHRERIVGCVIAQRIETAMEVVPAPSSSSTSPTAPTVTVDGETGLFCSPTLLPTHMGIPRLFVSSSHRRMGVATALLDAAAATFIHGCRLDKSKGDIAFSQPTGMGQAVMKSWGQGGVRVYEE
ncbi:hypothetical protein CPC08DRAFT_688984 [Agrocybe pediades]|nr:hypothetical protein CPC08DRAFT_688984 [Agrocybe pediades]